MRAIVVKGPSEAAQTGADLVVEAIGGRTATVMPAVGNTPMGLYAALARRHAAGTFDTRALRVVQLDEYLGIAPNDPRALYGWLDHSFLHPLDVPAEQVIRLPTDPADPEVAARAYETAVQAAGGIDLAILGLGPNGHLGFNEPPCDSNAPTRAVELAPASLQSNAGYWEADLPVPTHALTAGMDLILAAHRVLLLVIGANKQNILRRTLQEPPSEQVPASWLQRVPDAIVLADEAAWGVS